MKLETLVNYAKTYGFIYQGSEIYGGLANTWDYGPLGALLKKQIKDLWWHHFVERDPKVEGLDAAIFMHPKTWEASGHIAGFSDPLVDCKSCKTRHRADHLLEGAMTHLDIDGLSAEALTELIKDHAIKCPKCGHSDFTEIREFNLMFKTGMGVTKDSQSDVYLRPETAQGIFVNFKNVLRTSRQKIPFGIGQIGKSFRNEITPGQFIFRTREFEQCELEFFCEPGTEKGWFATYKEKMKAFLLDLGIQEDHLKFYDHPTAKLSHYSNATTDVLYEFPWGFDELWGLASRTDFDLKQHQAYSNDTLDYIDPITHQRYVPYVVEPSLGVDRLFLALIHDAYVEETLENDSRVVLKIDKRLAPYQLAVFPLIKKRHQEKALETFHHLLKSYRTAYDESGNIGRRYRRQDAIGTPYIITIDDDTLEQGTCTLRHRDSMNQETIKLSELDALLKDWLS